MSLDLGQRTCLGAQLQFTFSNHRGQSRQSFRARPLSRHSNAELVVLIKVLRDRLGAEKVGVRITSGE